jgi:multidrug efflux pump subunit AcrA (membrane-fusion protein)
MSRAAKKKPPVPVSRGNQKQLVPAAPPIVAPVPRPRGGRNRRAWAIAAVVVIVLGTAIAVGAWMHHSAALLAAAKAGEIATVTRGAIEKTVASSGKVVANLEVDIKCRAGGEIIKLPFDISQKVKQGDLLCQLDTKDEDLAVRSAEASVDQAAAKLAQARANLETAQLNLHTTRERDAAALASAKVKAENLLAKADRQKELVAQKLGSPEEYETAQTEAAAAVADQRAAEVAVEELKQQEVQLEFKRQDVKTAESQLQSDSIALDTQKQQLAYTTVTAPMDGTVSALNVQIGQIIASGLNAINGGTTILTLSDLSHVFVTATVDESDIGDVKVGQRARVMASSYPGRTFAGQVVRIAVKGVNTSNVVTFEVKVEVNDDHKDLLKPEMTGDVTIVEDQHRGVLMVPAAAVNRRNGQAYVTVISSSGKKQERNVTLGLEGAEMTEVTSGLSEGERVAVSAAELPTKWKNED